MADWNSLKPLKNQGKILSLVALLLTLILLLTPRHALRAGSETQSSQIDNLKQTSSVKATSGLSIRDQPRITGVLLTTAPNHAVLTILDENAKEDNVDGKSGNWFKVEYNGIVGFAWGNFIEK